MKYALNYRKILMSTSVIAFVAALAFAGTQAFYSDEEASTGNVFAAGAIDLKIDNHAWYNGIECSNEGNNEGEYTWQGDAQGDSYLETLVGQPCQSSWQLKDLESGDLFFNLTDLKPGDWEEDTISFHVENNDAWLCANLKVTKDDDVSSTEPELEAGDDEENGADNWDGELGEELNFIFWADDGDNVYESDETIVLEGTPSTLDGYGTDDNDGETFPLVDSTLNVWNGDGPLPASNDPVYIGKAFCFGEFALAPVTQDDDAETNSPAIDPGFTCDGASVTNMSQTDELMGDLAFYAVQSRNNPEFECSTDLFGGGDENEITVGPDDLFTVDDHDIDYRPAAFLSGEWFFYNDTNDTIMILDEFSPDGANNLVVGPEATGAAQMILHDIGARYNIATYQFFGTPLADIDSLKYRIYDASASGETPYLHFNVSYDGTDTWQGRLVQVPTGVSEDVWTEVDALASTWTKTSGDWPVGVVTAAPFSGATPRTWADILADYPSAEIRETDSFFGVRVGHPGPDGEEGYVDWIEFDNVVHNFGA